MVAKKTRDCKLNGPWTLRGPLHPSDGLRAFRRIMTQDETPGAEEDLLMQEDSGSLFQA
jgi:hypothetical protein